MTFTLGGLTGYGYGLAVGGSYLLYLALAGVLGYRRRLPAGTVRVFGLLGLPLGLVLARFVYCAVEYAYFTDTISQPSRMLSFWDGGYSLMGALCGLVLAALIAARLMRVRFGTLLDVAAAPLGALLCGVRLAEGLTGTAGQLIQLGVGRQVEPGSFTQALPWLFLDDSMGTLTLKRLAVYRVEAAVALVLLALSLWLFFGRHPRRKQRPGDVAMIVFSLFGASQVLLESLRDDSHMLLGFIRTQQVAAVLMPLLALAVFGTRYAHIRQARKTAVAAWLLLPVAALVGWMMVSPLNHVLDLTNRRALGAGILAAIAVYEVFFLRLRGADRRLTLTWLVALLALAGCVAVEFSIDGSNNVLRDYLAMALCCAALFLAPFTLWRALRKRVYREESLSVHIADAR